MKRATVVMVTLAIVFVWAGSAATQSKKGRPKAASGAPETVIYDAASAMAFLASRAGDWESGTGEHEHGGPASPRNIVSVRTKAAGSAVVQTYAAGTPGEMETIYHMDGDKLLLTHYCVLQNAPVLRFEKSNKPGELKFVFDGGTNFDPNVDAHLHETTIQIKDKDTVEQTSTTFANGKANPGRKVVLHRKSTSN
jgi:hypothetical protein